MVVGRLVQKTVVCQSLFQYFVASERTSTGGVETPLNIPKLSTWSTLGEELDSHLYLGLGRFELMSPIWRNKMFYFDTMFKAEHLIFYAACEGKMCSGNAKNCREA